MLEKERKIFWNLISKKSGAMDNCYYRRQDIGSKKLSVFRDEKKKLISPEASAQLRAELDRELEVQTTLEYNYCHTDYKSFKKKRRF